MSSLIPACAGHDDPHLIHDESRLPRNQQEDPQPGQLQQGCGDIAEGHGSRNREAFAPVLLEMAGIPTLGSDGLTLSLTLDKHWTNRMLLAAGIAVPASVLIHSAEEAGRVALPGDFPLFVKPRWEGTAKGIGPASRVEDRAALVARVEALVTEGRSGARALYQLKKDPSRMLTTILIGNNLVNIGASALATVIATERFGRIGPGIAVGCLTLAILIFVSVLPIMITNIRRMQREN